MLQKDLRFEREARRKANMAHTSRYDTRARELLLKEPERSAFIELNEYADINGSCPSCGTTVSRYERDRCNHARLCRQLLSDVANVTYRSPK